MGPALCFRDRLDRFRRSLQHRQRAAPRRALLLERLETRLCPAAHDTLGSAVALPFDSAGQAEIAAVLAAPNQADLYRVTLASGDLLTARVTAYTPSNTLDSVLRVFGSDGSQLAANDNHAGFDPFLTFVAPTAGSYYIGLSSSANVAYDPQTADSGSGGQSSGGYTLAAARSPFSEKEAAGATGLNDAIDTADVINGNAQVHGTIAAGDRDYFRLTVRETGLLTASATAGFVGRLMLHDASGNELVESISPQAGGSARFFQHLQPGTYYLSVTAFIEPASDRSYTLDTTFEPALAPFRSMRVGFNPRAVAFGDFDNDGKLDLASANEGDSTVSLLFGLGDSSFRSALSVTVGGAAVSVAARDFNNDTKLDLVTANDNGTVSVLLGKGDGTFQVAPAISVGTSAGSVAVDDFDRNGKLDLAITNTAGTGDKRVSVLLGQGDGSFSAATTASAGNDPVFVTAGDFDRDGKPDLAVANYANDTVSVLRGVGDGTFQALVAVQVGSGKGPVALATADIDGDKILDLVSVNQRDDSVSVWRGRGDGSFEARGAMPVGSHPTSVTIGDFDHKGNLDLAVGNRDDNTAAILLGNTDGTFADAVSLPLGGGGLAGGGAQGVIVADFDGNQQLDLATANSGDNTVSVLPGRGDGSFLLAPALFVGNRPAAVVLGDFDHDGNTDAATANSKSNTLSVVLGRGDGTFLDAGSLTVGNAPVSLAAGDFNGDGGLDLASANQDDNTVSVVLGRGDGTFLPALTLPAGTKPSGVVVGDFNGDHKLDLAATSQLDSSVWVWLGQGDGTFKSPKTIALPPTSQPLALATGDVNADGKIDLFTANSNTDKVSILRGRGDGTFDLDAPLSVGAMPVSIVVGDFNGDNRLDIATANRLSGTVTVLLGQQAGGFQATSLTVGDNPVSLATGDIDEDGRLDIVCTNLYGGSVSVLRGLGNAQFLASTLPAGNAPAAVAVSDINRDGHADLATANSGDNTLSVLLGLGTGAFETATPEAGVAVRHVPFLQDLDGDTVADSLILTSKGEILFRRGRAGTSRFEPPLTINPDQPARDVTVFRTTFGLAIAAIDSQVNTVSIYTRSGVDPRQPFRRETSFATGTLPVRIAAAPLHGGNSDDLVVTGDFDHSIRIALQTSAQPTKDMPVPAVSFADPISRTIGSGPSSIVFADLDNANGIDILVSDQVSGDVSVLFNDSTHSFARQARHAAGDGVRDIDASNGGQTVLSRHQTVGVVADDFTGSGHGQLLVVNRGDKSFVLLDQVQGRFAPLHLAGSSTATSARPGQVVSFRGDAGSPPDLAILMEDLEQIWVYDNDGHGAFAAPRIIDNLNGPRGLSAAQVDGKLALLVGNQYGDILTLLDDGHGSFTPDRAQLKDVPLAVLDLNKDGLKDVVVVDQLHDTVSVSFHDSSKKSFAAAAPLDLSQPLLAPGAVEMFTIAKDSDTYLAVANSLSNNVLVYHREADGQFSAPTVYAVGFNPVALAVGDIDGDGIKDLAVANQGSNDVSILIGAAPTPSSWTLTPYQRVPSGGSGPLAVSFRATTNSTHGPDLVVTNSDGKLAVLTGIGSSGNGTGFFAASTPTIVNVPAPIGGPLDNGLLPTSKGIFQLDLNRSTPTATQVFASSNLTALSDAGGGKVLAGFHGGDIKLLGHDATGALQTALIFRQSGLTTPSALEMVNNNGIQEIYATSEGQPTVFILTVNLSEGVAQLSSEGLFQLSTAELSTLTDAGLFLVATISNTGTVIDALSADGGFVAGIGQQLVPGDQAVTLVGDADADVVLDEDGNPIDMVSPGSDTSTRQNDQETPTLTDYITGVDEALRALRALIREERGVPDATDDPEERGVPDATDEPEERGVPDATDDPEAPSPNTQEQLDDGVPVPRHVQAADVSPAPTSHRQEPAPLRDDGVPEYADLPPLAGHDSNPGTQWLSLVVVGAWQGADAISRRSREDHRLGNWREPGSSSQQRKRNC